VLPLTLGQRRARASRAGDDTPEVLDHVLRRRANSTGRRLSLRGLTHSHLPRPTLFVDFSMRRISGIQLQAGSSPHASYDIPIVFITAADA